MELKPLPGSIEAMGRGQNMDLVYENSREEGRRVVNLYVNLRTKLSLTFFSSLLLLHLNYLPVKSMDRSFLKIEKTRKNTKTHPNKRSKMDSDLGFVL